VNPTVAENVGAADQQNPPAEPEPEMVTPDAPGGVLTVRLVSVMLSPPPGGVRVMAPVHVPVAVDMFTLNGGDSPRVVSRFRQTKQTSQAFEQRRRASGMFPGFVRSPIALPVPPHWLDTPTASPSGPPPLKALKSIAEIRVAPLTPGPGTGMGTVRGREPAFLRAWDSAVPSGPRALISVFLSTDIGCPMVFWPTFSAAATEIVMLAVSSLATTDLPVTGAFGGATVSMPTWQRISTDPASSRPIPVSSE
jgi:hypothetical protein